MKKIFLFSILSLMLLSASQIYAQQKSGTKKPANSTQKSNSGTLSKTDANKIIAMTNGVVDIYNEQISEINDITDCLDRFENSIDAIIKNPKGSAHGASCGNIKPLRSDLVEKMQANAKLAPAFPEKAAILEGIENVNKEFQTVIEKCKKIQAYMSGKEYNTDDEKFSKYVELRDDYIKSYDSIVDQFENIMFLSNQAGDRAEIVILKSSPIASVVVPMKNNLSAVSALMAKCRVDNPDAALIAAEIATIRKSLQKDMVITPAIKTALTKTHNGESYFKRFYEYEGNALNETETFLEFLNPAKEIKDIDHVLKETEEDARNRHLKKYYNKIKDQYRFMVDAYNSI